MAETGIAIAAARAEAVAATGGDRRPSGATRDPNSRISVVGRSGSKGALEDDLERLLGGRGRRRLRASAQRQRERDRAAGRTLDGPHRSDLLVAHAPKACAARQCSTGEQKALLLGLVLAHAELADATARGRRPILLLDEITAHLDADAAGGAVRRNPASRRPGMDDGNR